MTLLFFQTSITRSAFVLFFLSSAFSALSFLSLYASLSHYLLQNAWGNTRSCFVLGTGGVISQRSLCWCVGQGQSEDSWMYWLLSKLCFVCATDYIDFCSSLAPFAVDVGLVLDQARCSALKKIKAVFIHCLKERPVHYNWMFYHRVNTHLHSVILIENYSHNRVFLLMHIFLGCRHGFLFVTSSIFDLSFRLWWSVALIWPLAYCEDVVKGWKTHWFWWWKKKRNLCEIMFMIETRVGLN